MPDGIREELLGIARQIRGHLEFRQESGLDTDLASSGTTAAGSAKGSVLETLRTEIGDCTRCKLHPHRTHLVFGTGSPNARLMFIGEAPGEEEDLQGQPFVGKAGQLLTRIIQAMGLEREEVYIANILKCRPPGNRNPEPDEIATCEPFLRRQVEAIRPKIICALGTFAAQTLLQTDRKISALRGRFHDYRGTPLMPTYHPAYLLRNPEDKRLVWEDMKLIVTELKNLENQG
jgi:DNA polymerase